MSLGLAEEYLKAASRSLEEGLPNAAASAAVHAAICANDAICLARLGKRPHGETHGAAVGMLLQACRGTQCEKAASVHSRQLEQVLAIKTDAEYSGVALARKRAQTAVQQASRFVTWAREVVVEAGPRR